MFFLLFPELSHLLSLQLVELFTLISLGSGDKAIYYAD
jgi:hypothetical protein